MKRLSIAAMVLGAVGVVTAFVLWQALHQEYGDELLPPAKRLAPLVATDN